MPHPNTPNQDNTPLLGIESTGLFAEFVRRHALAVDDLTQEQLAEAIRQAMPDFRRNIHANAQSVVYLPGSEAEKWRTLYHELRAAIQYESLASALVKTGIVQEEAIECPCAYDDYKTQDAIYAMADILQNTSVTCPQERSD